MEDTTLTCEEDSTSIPREIHKCPLCFNLRNTFTCASCINQGNFNHSNDKTHRFKHGYSLKLKKIDGLAKEHHHLVNRVSESLKKRLMLEDKKLMINNVERNINIIKKSIEESKNNKEKKKLEYFKVIDSSKNHQNRIKKLSEKLNRARRYVEKYHSNLTKLNSSLEVTERKLQIQRKCNIEQLIYNIFPIEEHETNQEVELSSSNNINESVHVLALPNHIPDLLEAQQMSYINGQWVQAGNQSKTKYSIIVPEVYLPGNGDYSMYTAWYETHHQQHMLSGPDPESGGDTHIQSLCSALSFTAQLVSILAYYLNVNLPKKLCYSKFCGEELTPKSFSRAVAYLNINILYLCFSQHVKPGVLHPSYTLGNLLNCLNSEHSILGRSGWFEVNSKLVEPAEEATLPMLMLTQDEESDLEDSGSQAEFLECLEQDWETLPITSTVVVVPPGQAMNQSEASASTFTSGSAAAGIVSSAAASVASLWRAATGSTTMDSTTKK